MYQLLARFSPHGKEIQELGISPILELFAVCVHKDYGGRGIAAMIIKKTLELGDEQGCRLAVVQIANSLSEKIYNRLNFQTFKVLDLDTVADEFDLDTSIIPGETILSLMVKNLPSKTSNPHPQ
ncbi:uncharacterized protein LOC121861874 [Homarus americanus]|uniref:Putative FR47-like protein domain-containing protein 1 n=2 Tax=Homarus americanus TaxID=6706 RepID=A0A8J5TLY8_HOMAM|nr:uncharacterized protein LOC121857833 [Homarus americanus]XP_042215708.1 uncharacterized protein LOC121861874 [Homarus americanus]KAG7172413.1 putative FR47-like protein domain-containing protein 1 [Homarus americanus]KAG7175666.1 putative FR47-like protein domain-containing protein 3 [Homarus americanus]KAG7177360.1 putative FR47-like protein domain-containing protein 2 [Homarus americanus]